MQSTRTMAQLKSSTSSYFYTESEQSSVEKIQSYSISLDTSDLFTTATSSTTRGHNYKLFKPQATSRVRSTFFTVRAINDWNSLPNHIVNAPTLNDLKIFLTVAGLLYCMIIN